MDVLSLGAVPSTLSQDDVITIKTLYEELRRICALALERQVAVVIDAEHSGLVLRIFSHENKSFIVLSRYTVSSLHLCRDAVEP